MPQYDKDDEFFFVLDAGADMGVCMSAPGLYGPGGVRGFNPLTAGNVRIDGLYFDQQRAALESCGLIRVLAE
jgi:hypothetical protein